MGHAFAVSVLEVSRERPSVCDHGPLASLEEVDHVHQAGLVAARAVRRHDVVHVGGLRGDLASLSVLDVAGVDDVSGRPRPIDVVHLDEAHALQQLLGVVVHDALSHGMPEARLLGVPVGAVRGVVDLLQVPKDEVDHVAEVVHRQVSVGLPERPPHVEDVRPVLVVLLLAPAAAAGRLLLLFLFAGRRHRRLALFRVIGLVGPFEDVLRRQQHHLSHGVVAVHQEPRRLFDAIILVRAGLLHLLLEPLLGVEGLARAVGAPGQSPAGQRVVAVPALVAVVRREGVVLRHAQRHLGRLPLRQRLGLRGGGHVLDGRDLGGLVPPLALQLRQLHQPVPLLRVGPARALLVEHHLHGGVLRALGLQAVAHLLHVHVVEVELQHLGHPGDVGVPVLDVVDVPARDEIRQRELVLPPVGEQPPDVLLDLRRQLDGHAAAHVVPLVLGHEPVRVGRLALALQRRVLAHAHGLVLVEERLAGGEHRLRAEDEEDKVQIQVGHPDLLPEVGGGGALEEELLQVGRDLLPPPGLHRPFGVDGLLQLRVDPRLPLLQQQGGLGAADPLPLLVVAVRVAEVVLRAIRVLALQQHLRLLRGGHDALAHASFGLASEGVAVGVLELAELGLKAGQLGLLGHSGHLGLIAHALAVVREHVLELELRTASRRVAGERQLRAPRESRDGRPDVLQPSDALPRQPLFLRHLVLEELEGPVQALLRGGAHLEGRDARLLQRVPLDEQLRQHAALPELYHRVGQPEELVLHHPQLLQPGAAPDALGQGLEAVVGEVELPHKLELLDFVRETLQVVVRQVEQLQFTALHDAVGEQVQLVVRQVQIAQPARAHQEVARQEGYLVVRQVEDLQVRHGASADAVWLDGVYLVPVADEGLHLGLLRVNGGPLLVRGEKRYVVVGHSEMHEVVQLHDVRALLEMTPRDVNGVYLCHVRQLLHHVGADFRLIGLDGRLMLDGTGA
mmetsp:Transcript_39846/g.105393  ORF Transcript_39846/g.105393 Transcript_39846/m.105393 type:complete len:960 (+) Transcript_39846:61-2940(+)